MQAKKTSQLGLVDELTCDPAISSEYHDVGMQESSNPDFVSTWPSKFVSCWWLGYFGRLARHVVRF